jgi:hypothetical protein
VDRHGKSRSQYGHIIQARSQQPDSLIVLTTLAERPTQRNAATSREIWETLFF